MCAVVRIPMDDSFLCDAEVIADRERRRIASGEIERFKRHSAGWPNVLPILMTCEIVSRRSAYIEIPPPSQPTATSRHERRRHHQQRRENEDAAERLCTTVGVGGGGAVEFSASVVAVLLHYCGAYFY